MLQIFIDDSGSSPDDQYFVLGGVVTTAEQCVSFSKEWKKELQGPPELMYFKSSEANSMHGQFKHGWNRNLIARKVDDLARVVARNSRYTVHSVIRWEDFHELRREFKERYAGPSFPEWSTPYFVCTFSIAAILHRFAYKKNIEPNWKITLDEHGSIGNISADVLNTIKDPIIRRALGSDLTFGNDKLIPQLQGADLYAWQLHDFCVRNGLKHRDPSVKNVLLKIPEIGIMLEKDLLMKVKDALFAAIGQMAALEAKFSRK